MNDPKPILEVRDIVFQYSSSRGALGISLKIRQNECYAVLGRNGSGKSTLTRLLLGLEKPQSGELRLFDEPLSNLSRRRFRRIGVVLDTNAHWENLTGFQNAFFFACSYGMRPTEAERRIEELFSAADLTAQAHDRVADYSYGMRRKLAFTQALVHDPDLLVLDEPTAGVDAHFMVTLTTIIRERGRRGKSTWIAGNDADWIAGVAGRVAFMEQGKIVDEGSPEELIRAVSELREVRITLQDFSPAPPIEVPGISKLTQKGNTITALISRDLKPLPILLSRLAESMGSISHVDVIGGTLRDAFLFKTGKTLDQ